MNRLLLAVSAILVIFAGHSFAQALQTGPIKIGVINSGLFADDKAGITRYVSAVKTLNNEFASTDTELRGLNSRLEVINKELQQARGVPNVQQSTFAARIEEGEKITREIKFKSDDAKARYQRREQTLLGPIMQDIYKALQEFSKAKGFTMIFDAAKDQAGFLVAVGDDKVVVTKDFIAFYNARPANATVVK